MSPPTPKATRRNTVRTRLRRLIERAGRTQARQTRRIMSRVLDLPHYRGLPHPEIENARETVAYHLDLFYRVTLGIGRKLSSTELEPSRRNARLRASQGVPLGELLSVYQSGSTIVWDDLHAAAGSDPDLRASLLHLLPAIIRNQTQVTTAITEAYVEERESLSHFRERDLDDFFQQLLSDDVPEKLLEIRAKALGVRPDEPNTIVLFRPAPLAAAEEAGASPEHARRLLSSRMKALEALVGRCQEGYVALLRRDPDLKDLGAIARSLFGDAGRVGIGGTAREIADLRRSAREASRALEIGSLVQPKTLVHRYADLAILDLVRIGSPDAEAFVRSVLGPLAESSANKSSLETLRQLVRNGFRVKLAAAALSIHPNTLAYRLKQIHERHGIDLEDPQTRLKLHLALLILDSSSPTPSS